MNMRVFKGSLAILLVMLTILFCCCGSVAALSYKFGSSGDTVIEIQKRLKAWGYYFGDVDGYYGKQTEDAVIMFQIRHGITIDGIVGSETAEMLGISLSSPTSASDQPDVYLLARLIYAESRGEPYKGQVAVAAVVLNRVESSQFPNSIANVIYQSGAFSVVDDGQINLSPDATALNAARDAINGWDPSGGALFYYNPDTATSGWIWTRPVICVIGKHKFCS